MTTNNTRLFKKSLLAVTITLASSQAIHHRADDGPAYLTILVVGHLMAPLIHIVFTTYRPEPATLASIFTVGCVGLSLWLLPRMKGAMVGFQWAKRMHGFGELPGQQPAE